jgi:Na+-transporting methylmalonyl-CoA/oxaloacetate decarboxylase beta subunit
MFEAIVNGLSGLTAGVANLHWSNPVMIAIGCLFLFLGIKKDVEPLLLVPIGALALYNRRIIVALSNVSRPNGPTLALVRRTAGAELALSLVIVIVASVLVAQVPGGA